MSWCECEQLEDIYNPEAKRDDHFYNAIEETYRLEQIKR